MNANKSPKGKVASIRARLKFRTEQDFISKYAPNVSKTGIFVKTQKPRAIGTKVAFEFQIADGTVVLRGIGEVSWLSEAGSGKPSGMGIKFAKLDRKSKGIIDKCVRLNTDDRGAEKAEADALKAASTPPSTPKPEPEPASESKPEPDPEPAPPETEPTKARRKTSRSKKKKIDLGEIDSLLAEMGASKTKKKRRKSRRRRPSQPPSEERVAAPEPQVAMETTPTPEPESTEVSESRTDADPDSSRQRAANMLYTSGLNQDTGLFELGEKSRLEEEQSADRSADPADSDGDQPADDEAVIDAQSLLDDDDLLEDDGILGENELPENDAIAADDEIVEEEGIVEEEEIVEQEPAPITGTSRISELISEEVQEGDIGDVIPEEDVNPLEHLSEPPGNNENLYDLSADEDLSEEDIESDGDFMDMLLTGDDAEAVQEEAETSAATDVDGTGYLEGPIVIEVDSEPLLDNGEVNEALNELFTQVDPDFEDIEMEEPPETLPDEAVPPGLVRERPKRPAPPAPPTPPPPPRTPAAQDPEDAPSTGSSPNPIYESDSPQAEGAHVPVPEAPPVKEDENKKKGLFKKLFGQ